MAMACSRRFVWLFASKGHRKTHLPYRAVQCCARTEDSGFCLGKYTYVNMHFPRIRLIILDQTIFFGALWNCVSHDSHDFKLVAHQDTANNDPL